MTTQRKGLVGYEDVNLWEGDVNDKRFDRENSQNQLISPHKLGATPSDTDFYRFQNLIHKHDGPGGVFVDVRHYGAVGDGATDDTAAIVAAQAAVGASGVVYFPRGTYMVSGLTISASNQRFISDIGAEIMLIAASNDDVITISESYVRIINLTIDGNKANQTGASNCISIGFGLTDIEIRDCIIENAYTDGINVTAAAGTSYVNITNCSIQTPNGDGIAFDQGVSNSQITDCFIKTPALNGIVIDTSSANCVVSGNVLYDVTRNGIDVDADRCTITGNVITVDGGATYSGIDLNDSNNCTVTGNAVYVSGSDDTTGIYCAAGDYNVIADNILQSGSDMAIGVELFGCVGCVVSGNTIDGVINGTTKTAYGVKVTAGGTGGFPNIIKGNLINVNGASAAGILLFTETNTHVLEGCVIEGNIIQVEGNAATRGIELYCNHAGAFVDRNIIMGNSLRGNSASTQTAILFDENGTGGTMAGNIIMGNVIQDWPVGIQPDGDTQTRITNNQFYNNEDDFAADVATAFDRFGEVDVHGTW